MGKRQANGLTGKENRVLDYIISKGSISNKQAIEDLGDGRLSQTISQLRKKGYDIKTVRVDIVNRHGEETWYGKYMF